MFYSRTGWDAGEQRAFELVKIANYLIRVHAFREPTGLWDMRKIAWVIFLALAARLLLTLFCAKQADTLQPDE
jgi:hypothetical protein